MPEQTTPTALADRLAVLSIEAEELAAMIRRPADEVAAWVAGEAEPDGEAKVLLRIVTDPQRAHAAALAVARVREGWTQNMRGDDWQTADVERPAYGSGYHGPTGAKRV